MGVHVGQFPQWKQIAYKVVYCIRTTEGYFIHEEKLYCCMEKSPHPGPSQQDAAHPRPHDGHVMKRITDSHGAVMRHHGEEDDAQSTKEVLSKELDHAAFQGNATDLREGVHNQLGCNEWKRKWHPKGQGLKKKIHG